MSQSLNRRTLLAAGSAAVGTLLLDPTSRSLARLQPEAGAYPPGDAGSLPDGFPAQEAAAVREVVSVSHFSLERVRALVDERPELAKAAWDWGFGDWESALGAASHTGNREIAEYLIANGARPNLFTAAMLGELAVVRAFVAARPGIQSQPGPHGITLRRHAELGGEAAKPVLDYLDELGDADNGPTDLPLELDREAYVGTYAFGAGDQDRFVVSIARRGNLALQRGDGTPRALLHQGGHRFHPAGAPSAGIRFAVEEGAVVALEIHNPGLVVSASRSASPSAPAAASG